MAVTIQRSIYINSSASIIPVGTPGGGNIPAAGLVVPLVQSANFSLNIPRADVNAFGFDGVLDRPQLEAETATMELSWVAETVSSATVASSLLPAHLNDLVRDSKAQIPAYIYVFADGVGGIKNSLMNSLSGEATVGALSTMSGSWTGATNDPTNMQNAANQVLGEPGGGNANTTPVAGSTFTGTLVTPQDINLKSSVTNAAGVSSVDLIDEFLEPNAVHDADQIVESCAQSASFSWDMPVEIILCLGSNPASDGLALGNPPGSASFTVEALSAQLQSNTASANYGLNIGQYGFFLTNGNIDSRTHNLAVGDLYGTYNYVVGGTGDGFEIV